MSLGPSFSLQMFLLCRTLTLHIQWSIKVSFLQSLRMSSGCTARFPLPCNIDLYTRASYNLHFTLKERPFVVSRIRCSLNLSILKYIPSHLHIRRRIYSTTHDIRNLFWTSMVALYDNTSALSFPHLYIPNCTDFCKPWIIWIMRIWIIILEICRHSCFWIHVKSGSLRPQCSSGNYTLLPVRICTSLQIYSWGNHFNIKENFFEVVLLLIHTSMNSILKRQVLIRGVASLFILKILNNLNNINSIFLYSKIQHYCMVRPHAFTRLLKVISLLRIRFYVWSYILCCIIHTFNDGLSFQC